MWPVWFKFTLMNCKPVLKFWIMQNPFYKMLRLHVTVFQPHSSTGADDRHGCARNPLWHAADVFPVWHWPLDTEMAFSFCPWLQIMGKQVPGRSMKRLEQQRHCRRHLEKPCHTAWACARLISPNIHEYKCTKKISSNLPISAISLILKQHCKIFWA